MNKWKYQQISKLKNEIKHYFYKVDRLYYNLNRVATRVILRDFT